MTGVYVTIQYSEDFDRSRVEQVAQRAPDTFEGRPGLRFKFFTVDEKEKRAVNFYVSDSVKAADAFSTTNLETEWPVSTGQADYQLSGDRRGGGQLAPVSSTSLLCARPAGGWPQHPRRYGTFSAPQEAVNKTGPQILLDPHMRRIVPLDASALAPFEVIGPSDPLAL